MNPNTTWEPKAMPSRPADTTENIHRVIGWIYLVLCALVLLLTLSVGRGYRGDFGIMAGIMAFLGAVSALHFLLAAGARRRSGFAKVGSILVGCLMLLGFPIGTIVGGFLIYNASQDWPPRHVGPAAPAGPDMRGL